MDSSPVSPRLAFIQLHPIKALDSVHVKEARIGPGGGLELDRAWALYSADGQWVNGKRTPAVHLIRAAYAPDLTAVSLSVPGDRRGVPTSTFAFPGDTAGAAEWFSAYFEQQINIRYSLEGFPDDSIANGPTIISAASIDTVSTWFSGLTAGDVRLRFRTTLEIDDVPAFWEDQLFGEEERSAVRFRIGEVNFEGSNPCARCAVPPRNPHTGGDITGFQKRFSELRRANLPPWSPKGRFDHFYRLATNTRVAPSESGKILRVGDPVLLQ
ncbi:MAG: MOSC domain-containing protein [Acidobacteria bacterium]|jgi:uncharacterized protein YcbX|nr:MAG: MOSC domain-containing protein [Acidobacteriota bacterium]